MGEFSKKNLLELKKMTIKELSQYYVDLRKYDYNSGKSINNIEIRKKIHSGLSNLLKIDRVLSGDLLCTISDRRVETNNPKIYICYYICGNNIQRVIEAINDYGVLYVINPNELYRTSGKLLMFLNGAICLEALDIADRKIAYKNAIKVLSNNNNLIVYSPESRGIYDKTSVLDLYYDISFLQFETGAEIIPVIFEKHINKFYVCYGRNVSPVSKEYIYNHNNRILNEQFSVLKNKIWDEITKDYIKSRSI